MTRLILSLFTIFYVVGCRAQTRDTIPVIMLVSDTAWHCCYAGIVNGKRSDTMRIVEYNVTWQYGYEVMEWPDKNGYVITGTFATFIGYLDENKKPLTLFCWMSKEIKK